MWSNDLRKKRNYVRALRKKTTLPEATQEDYAKFKKERAIYRKNIQQAKKNTWKKFCENTKDPYGKIKTVAFQDFYRQEVYALQTSHQNLQTRQNLFQEITETIFGPSQDQPIPEITQNKFAHPILPQEIKNAIYSFNKNKAPGPD